MANVARLLPETRVSPVFNAGRSAFYFNAIQQVIEMDTECTGWNKNSRRLRLVSVVNPCLGSVTKL